MDRAPRSTMIALEVVKLALWSIEMILMSWSSGTLYSCSSISEDVGGRLLRGGAKMMSFPSHVGSILTHILTWLTHILIWLSWVYVVTLAERCVHVA